MCSAAGDQLERAVSDRSLARDARSRRLEREKAKERGGEADEEGVPPSSEGLQQQG
eukprot:COSAG05_NODE_12763_length_455_cov_1.303371_1_plen_55_part_01